MAEPTLSGRRPLILIPSRFSASASALRYRAEVAARALVEAVYAAGGEPLLLHPHAPGGSADLDEVAARLAIADGVLSPGGGDLDPSWAGQQPHPSQYDVDVEQDAFDLAVARIALESGLPLLAICRGTQVVNVVLGGDIVQDMVRDHRHHTHVVNTATGSLLHGLVGDELAVSCYHHQCLGTLGAGLVVTATAADGAIEAVELPERSAWFVGTQWHPEDTAATDAAQAALFGAFVRAASRRVTPGVRRRPRPRPPAGSSRR